MHRNLIAMFDYTVNASDGDIGTVRDFYFDDHDWQVRYLVVDTGIWRSSRPVLIPIEAIREGTWPERHICVNLTRAQVENSAELDLELPFKRQQELARGMIDGAPRDSRLPLSAIPVAAPDRDERLPGNPHLRSARDVRGYHVGASDHEIGHIEDFIVDTRRWSIAYLLVDTSNWWFGRRVLIAPDWVTRVEWVEAKVYLNHTRGEVRSSPEYDPSLPIAGDYEARLHSHYRRDR